MRVVVVIIVTFLSGCLHWHSQRMPDAPSDAAYATLQGTEIHYKETGDATKPAVILLHGFASSLNAWARVQPELSKHFRVVSIDLKGFGLSGRPPGDYSPVAQAKLVVAVMDRLDIKRASIVGHSWGSSVTLALALSAPERVDKIALYDAWVYDEQLPTFFRWSKASGVGEALFAMFYKERPADKMERAFYDKSVVTHEYSEAVRNSLERPGTTRAALQAVRDQDLKSLETRYQTIENDTLLLWGKEDAIASLDIGVRLSRDLPNASLKVYENCGHFPMEEAFETSTADLVDFLRGER